MTKISSKGQVVIPAEMRKSLHEGDKLLIIQNEGQIILKKAGEMEKQLAEDIEFAKKTEDALKRIESGKGTRMEFDGFIKEIKKW